MKVVVVIAVHNRKKHTLNCLQQLSDQTFKDFECIVVDDGSVDGTTDEIQNSFPDTHIVKGDGEWWWAKSMNEGFKKAMDLDAEVIITLNNDLYFDKDLIGNLMKIHNRYPASVIGCLNTVVKDREYIFFSGIRKIQWWKAKEEKYHTPFSNYKADLTGLHPSLCLNGRGTLIPVDVFNTIGYYNEDHFPQYGADYDFTIRAVDAGFKVSISWDIKVKSILEETGEGRTFVKQSWKSFLSSFHNPYAATSWRMWYNYYTRHAGWQSITGLPTQFLRLGYSFYRKQKQIGGLI